MLIHYRVLFVALSGTLLTPIVWSISYESE